MINNLLTRRRFFSALAASVVAAGMPLPVGFPRELKWTAAGPGKITFENFRELMYGDYLLSVIDENNKTILLYPGSHPNHKISLTAYEKFKKCSN